MIPCIYFITENTYKRINLFQYNPRFAEMFLENLKFCNQKFRMNSLAYTLMPEHFHLEISPNSEDFEVAKILGRFKGYTSKLILDDIKKYFQKIGG